MIYGIIGLFICIGIPVLGGICFAWYRKGTFLTFLVGILSFVVTQLVLRIPLINLLGREWDWFALLPITNPVLYGLILAFTAGLFEETGRYIGLKYLRAGRTDWANGFAFGLGHGGVEAVWIGCMGLLPALLNGTLGLAGVQGLLVGAERLCAMLFHTGMTMIVLTGIRKGKRRFWLYAILLHGLFDAALIIKNHIFIWSVLIGSALLSLLYLIWTKQQWNKEKENVR